MPTSELDPDYELPPWAEGNFPGLIGDTQWSGLPRRVAAGLDAFASAGLIPTEPTESELTNEWLGRSQEILALLRDQAGTAIFGDGSDGPTTIAAGTTVLTEDLYASDLTIEAGGTLNAAGYRVFVSGTLSIAATGFLQNVGGAASGGTAGAAGAGGTLGAGSAGGTGVTNSSGQVGNAGAACSSTLAIGGAGASGGAAGAFAGGAGGTAAVAVASGGFRNLGASLGYSMAASQWRGGSGGGSGGTLNGTGTSGGGGGGGGCLVIYARAVSNLGTIRANGGAGGNATAGTSTSVGGGSGGGGGAVWLVHREAVGGSLGTVTASGGAGGTAVGTGTAGTAGADGNVITLVG